MLNNMQDMSIEELIDAGSNIAASLMLDEDIGCSVNKAKDTLSLIRQVIVEKSKPNPHAKIIDAQFYHFKRLAPEVNIPYQLFVKEYPRVLLGIIRGEIR